MELLTISLFLIICGAFCVIYSLFKGYTSGTGISKMRVEILIGVFFIIYGAAVIVCERIFGQTCGVVVFMLGLAGILIFTEWMRISNLIKCKKVIEAKYVGCQTYTNRGVTYYTPTFEYKYNGVSYKGTTFQNFGKRFMKKHFEDGSYYNIYINPSNPETLIVEKRIFFSDIVVLLLIAVLIGVSISLVTGIATVQKSKRNRKFT